MTDEERILRLACLIAIQHLLDEYWPEVSHTAAEEIYCLREGLTVPVTGEPGEDPIFTFSNHSTHDLVWLLLNTQQDRVQRLALLVCTLREVRATIAS